MDLTKKKKQENLISEIERAVCKTAVYAAELGITHSAFMEALENSVLKAEDVFLANVQELAEQGKS